MAEPGFDQRVWAEVARIPWHRVVNARGCISMALSREGSDWMQADLPAAAGGATPGAEAPARPES